MEALRKQIVEYAQGQLGCSVDAPFAKYPEYLVIRHPSNGKWAAAIMCVPACKVGGAGAGEVDVMNVKLDPLLVATLRSEPGYSPAWHMNKEHWLTVLLDGTVTFDRVSALFEMSYALVAPRRDSRWTEVHKEVKLDE